MERFIEKKDLSSGLGKKPAKDGEIRTMVEELLRGANPWNIAFKFIRDDLGLSDKDKWARFTAQNIMVVEDVYKEVNELAKAIGEVGASLRNLRNLIEKR